MTTIMLVAAAVGTTASPAGFQDDFHGADGATWNVLSGSASYGTSSDNWAGNLLAWMELEGLNATGAPEQGRVLVDAAQANTTWSSYRLTAIVERDADAPTPGAFGITFGEVSGQGHYTASFDDDAFVLGVPDGATGGTSTLLTQADWGEVPDHVAGVDNRLRYVLEVEGTMLTVKVNGWLMGSYLLPGTAPGLFGFTNAEGSRIHIQEVTYTYVDRIPPVVEIFRPLSGHYYLEDIEVPTFATGITMATGVLTLGAEILDARGVKDARITVNGELLGGSRTKDAGGETIWQIDTTRLSAGYHNITVIAVDHAGNVGKDSVEILVLNDDLTTKTVSDVARTLDHLIP